uniref:Truncated boron transporter n=1 Tax=Triticum aestivum TaxID=4565 RepID=A0A067ZUK3_WHEAT|nr:truncated boron transporter [Triticum aestivum]
MDLLASPFKGVVQDVKGRLGTRTTGLQGCVPASGFWHLPCTYSLHLPCRSSPSESN